MVTRHGQVTPLNHGAFVVVTGYIMMVTMILFVLTRLITKALATRSLKIDDFLIVAATVTEDFHLTQLTRICRISG